jgi:tetratricopeptide (TPR) repeat protein
MAANKIVATKIDRKMNLAWKSLAAVCALVLGVYAYSAGSGAMESLLPNPAGTDYNLLVQGLRAGQLSLKKDVPPGLAQLADPYDPVANAPFRSAPYGLHDLSYYKGRLFLYFGITPALILFWPFAALTDQYLFHRDAVAVFSAIGFLTSAGLLLALWRRYFADVSAWVVAACALALGLATGLPILVSSAEVYQVPISCGYMLTMLALAAIWCALHEPHRRWRWLAAASVAYGLAVGARPSLLFGAVILLAPVAQARRERRQVWAALLAATVPIILIGLGLMLYNSLRFDSPFEFGEHYELEASRVTQGFFSLRYLWFNFRVYFLEPARWGGRFPFVHDIVAPPVPPGHGGVEKAFGILTNVPLVWLALAVPLAWRGRPAEARSILRGFLLAVALLFGICALTVSLFWCAISRYEVDFLPALLLLAVVGILGLERALAPIPSSGLADQPARRRTARWCWGLLLGFSVAFNLLASARQHAEVHYSVGTDLVRLGRIQEAIGQYEQALQIEPDYTEAHYNLANAFLQTGNLAEAIGHFYEALPSLPESTMAPYGDAVHDTLGNALLQAGRLPEAIKQYEQALQIKPDYAEAHYNLGNALTRAGRVLEAINHYQRAIQIKPDYAEAHYRLAVALEKAGNIPDAIRHYEQAVRINPDYDQAHRDLALALEQTHRAREAIGHYEQALRIKPDRPLVENNLAWLLATLAPADGGDPVRAVTMAERICQLTDYRMPPYLDTLAAAYASAGRFDDAVAIARKAIDLANSAGLPQVAKQIESRLQLYRRGQPYRRTVDATNPPNP